MKARINTAWRSAGKRLTEAKYSRTVLGPGASLAAAIGGAAGGAAAGVAMAGGAGKGRGAGVASSRSQRLILRAASEGRPAAAVALLLAPADDGPATVVAVAVLPAAVLGSCASWRNTAFDGDGGRRAPVGVPGRFHRLARCAALADGSVTILGPLATSAVVDGRALAG